MNTRIASQVEALLVIQAIPQDILLHLPKERKAVKNCWVFNIKPDGRYRSRLVAKGFSQVEGIDFNELFSPVVHYETA